MIYNRPFRDAAKKYCLLGRPADCLEQLQAFAVAGCCHFVLSPLMDPDESVAVRYRRATVRISSSWRSGLDP
jgi:alkanesulfonate monooxygenase SsuD/methylene tetrahydromethanopterin reductase-like flavin-dependent oxidoreductase (luciferase family)